MEIKEIVGLQGAGGYLGLGCPPSQLSAFLQGRAQGDNGDTGWVAPTQGVQESWEPGESLQELLGV